jgi:hypothetical protein
MDVDDVDLGGDADAQSSDTSRPDAVLLIVLGEPS